MSYFRVFILAISLMSFSTISFTTMADDANQLNKIETIDIHYKEFKTPLVFNVTLPASYQKDKDKRYFVLFDLHPRIQPFLSGAQDWLSHNGEWPWLETIIVTPSNYHPEFAALFEDTGKAPQNRELLDFIEHHVLTAIDKTYRTNGFNIYSGFMGNGALGLYAMLNRPSLFNAYFIASPTLNNDFLQVVSSVKDKLPTLFDKQRFLYLTIGEHSYEKSHVASVEQFKTLFTQYAPSTLDWQIDTKDPHYYMSRPVFTVLNGIEKLFDDYHKPLAADSSISKQGADAIIQYYMDLSEHKYGFDISAEGSLKNLAKSLLISSPSKAIALYQRTTLLYPDSTYAYYALASAYYETGNIALAISAQEQAVEKSKAMVVWHQNKMNKQLAKYQKALN